MSRLSILIPALGSADLLEETLVSVLENRPPDCEVLVVLNRPYDDPYQLEGEVRFMIAGPRARLADVVNLALSSARAPIVHLLAEGALVNEGWVEQPLDHFRDPRVAAVAPLVLEKDNPQRVASAGVEYQAGGTRRLRARGSAAAGVAGKPAPILGPSTRAAFYRRSALASLGGAFDRSLGDRLADVDLALRLRDAGYVAVFEPASIVQAAGIESCDGSAFREALEAERLFWRHARAAGLPRSVMLHALLVASEFIGTLPRPTAVAKVAGRLLGSCAWGEHRRSQLRYRLTTVPLPIRTSSDQRAVRLDGPHGKEGGRQARASTRSCSAGHRKE